MMVEHHYSEREMKLLGSERFFIWGLLLLLLTLASALAAYYLYSPLLRQFSFALMVVSLLVLMLGMVKDVAYALPSKKWVAWGLVAIVLVLYFVQRLALPRYDFSVGDPSDYFIAGVCSVTYSQDIGFFMPLTASITALGYEVLGIAYAPFVNVILYAVSIPISYFIFKKLTTTIWISMMMSALLIFVPVSILFSKASFTEPTWQTLLMVFSINAYYMLSSNKLGWKHIVIFYLVLFLAPFLRGEGVVYYGLILFVMLYHYWKYSDFKSMLWLAMGTGILAGSVQLTLLVRSNYLLNMQFSRVIPHITEFQLMSILYGAAGVAFLIVLVLYVIRNRYSRLSLPAILVVLSLLFKVGVSYIYASKKHTTMLKLLFLNEYGLAVGNFGLPLTLFIIIGLILLYIRAMRGEIVAMILVMLYALFHLSWVMQAVTFTDVHAMFLYWNRYYLSVFMMVHLFALGLMFHLLYGYLAKWLKKSVLTNILFMVFVVLLILFSVPLKMYEIAVIEAHQKDSYLFYEWLKERVGREPISVLSDSSVIYKQNKEHIGLNDLKYMVSRTFSIYKINAKSYQRIQPHKFHKGLKFQVPLAKVHYVLALGKKDYHLEDESLKVVDTFTLPLEWREHFGLDKNATSIHHGDVTKSVVKHIPFTAVLYRVDKKVAMGEKVAFRQHAQISSQMLKDGWTFINNRSSAFCASGKGIVSLPKLAQESKYYSVTLRYAVINASEAMSKEITFSIADEVLRVEKVDAYTTREVTLEIPKHLRPTKDKDASLSLVVSNKGQIMLRSITINKKGKQ